MSNLYTQMIEQMENGAYTSIKAQSTINAFLAQQQITEDEYNDLMERTKALDVNPGSAEMLLRISALEERVSGMENEIESIKEAVASGSTEIPEPDPGQVGGKDNPIEASRGMTYYKGKYYLDPEDGKTYQCIRDNDSEPGSGMALAYLPHELDGIYFSVVVEEE